MPIHYLWVILAAIFIKRHSSFSSGHSKPGKHQLAMTGRDRAELLRGESPAAGIKISEREIFIISCKTRMGYVLSFKYLLPFSFSICLCTMWIVA
jgi:hypothetical protein